MARWGRAQRVFARAYANRPNVSGCLPNLCETRIGSHAVTSPTDARIAAENAALRALDRRTAQQQPQRPPLPDGPTVRARLHAHGDDSGAAVRDKWADDLSSVTSSIDKVRKNPTLNAAQVEVAVADIVQGRVNRLLAECDDETLRIDAAEREVEQGIDTALSPARPEWYALGAEYRAALLDMTSDERWDFVKSMEGTRYAPLLRYAIASVPPELSGVSPTQHTEAVTTLLAIKDPDLLTRPADLRKRRAALAKAVEGIQTTAAELADFEKADAIKALAQ